ncbi:extracellular catalytic domain type 1 short-chain-length polyhydroxyalkanoate depolymerase [Aureispira anguillae]|uniref:T9SS type A sorting domain-containing protein n=1 Tax=Aureispira anguillae TaxID=2864201 RepID=A0A915YKM3_9BACT|nr:PHB depolymerase family esterase [Aureispira anguillae]BDS14692.1 T9SS type A sorting domain-containing protein [Aureispira anguillae]
MKSIILIVSLLLSCTLSFAQNVTGNFMHNGLNRAYTLYIPANYNVANTHPIVFNLHGYTSTGTQQAALSNMNAIADTAGFIVAYPEGTLDASSKTYWNSGYGTGVDDIGFIDALIDTIAANYTVDLQRVYSTGLSNGAIMSNTLACALNHRIAAIAGVAGTMSILQQTTCAPANPIPVMQIHGTSDVVVPYLGNTVLLGVDALVNHWRGHNGLTNTFSTTPIANTNLLDGSTAELIQYETGASFPVHLIRVTNGGHSWPGSGVIISGTTNMDFDASVEIWKFFSQYSLVTSTSKLADVSPANWVRLTGSNPIVDNLSWELDQEEDYELTIYDLLGKAIEHRSFQNNRGWAIDIRRLEAGTYFAVYTSPTQKKALKFIKNK